MALQKTAVVQAFIASLQNDVDSVVAAARATHDAATHPEAKPENDKDTRALEAGYLAGAQSARAAELQQHLAAVARTDISGFSLVTLQETTAKKGAPLVVLLSKWGGGQKVDVDGVVVQIITPHSPIGMAVGNEAAGSEVEVEMGPRVRRFTIVSRS